MDGIKCSILLLSLMLTVCAGSTTCPAACDCVRDTEGHLVVNCSRRGLTSIPPDLDLIENDVYAVDLSYNQIPSLHRDSFNALRQTSLKILKLQRNDISNVAPFTFSNLNGIKEIDLSHNRISELRQKTFSEISGIDDDDENQLNLFGNPIGRISGSAFNFVRGLRILIGHSDRPLSISPSAFYVCTNIPTILFHSIPQIDLLPGAFTNTENLLLLHFENVTFQTIRRFSFPGFTNLGTLYFSDCTFHRMDSYAFGGIVYKSVSVKYGDIGNGTNGIESPITSKGGGLFKMEHCRLDTLPGDSFRDTNLARIDLRDNQINVIEPQFVRGLSALQTLELVNNNISHLASDSLGSLVGVREIRLDRNDIRSIGEHTFRNTRNLDSLVVHLRAGTHLLLETRAFAEAVDIKEVLISGEVPSSNPAATVTVTEDAFNDLVGVHSLRIVNVYLPTLTRHSFRGLSKVQALQFVNCNVSYIEPLAFGPTTYNPGAVDLLDLSSGNNLPCNCSTMERLHEIKGLFGDVSLSCIDSDGSQRTRALNDLNFDQELELCRNSNSGISVQLSFNVALIVLFFHQFFSKYVKCVME